VTASLDGVDENDLKPDYYAVTLAQDEVVIAYTLTAGGDPMDDADTVLKFIDSTGTVLSENDDYFGQEDTFFSSSKLRAPAAGTYYIVVEPYCGGDTSGGCGGNGDYVVHAASVP
jgi:hypothetical protein